MRVVGTNTVELSAKRIEGDVAIVCSANESMKSKSKQTKKKIQLRTITILAVFFSFMYLCEEEKGTFYFGSLLFSFELS
jgi:hypothetical protein